MVERSHSGSGAREALLGAFARKFAGAGLAIACFASFPFTTGVCLSLAHGADAARLEIAAVVTPRSADSSPASDASARKPVPDLDAQAKAEKAVREIFGSEFTSRSPAAKKGLVAKLQREAKLTSDSARQYVLMRDAMDLCASAGDIDSAFSSLDTLAAAFDVDPAKIKPHLVTTAAASVETPAQAKVLAFAILAMAESDLAEGNSAQASRTLAFVDRPLRHLSDPATVAATQARIVKLRNQIHHLQLIEPSLVKLRQNPDDPDANEKVGKFYCFAREDWKTGLPMLAKSRDTTLRKLAEKEAVPPTDAIGKVELGDGWWDAARSQGASATLPCQQRAVFWYKSVEHDVGAPILKKIKPRIAAVPQTHVVDLLELVNPAKDTVSGSWSMADGMLIAGKGTNIIEFPYRPPSEYDLSVSFTMTSGDMDFESIHPGPKGNFNFAISKAECGFERVQGKGVYQSSASTALKAAPGLHDKVAVVVQVRVDGVKAFVNGALVSHWNNLSELDGSFPLKQPGVLGLRFPLGTAAFDVVQVTELTGEGKKLR